MPPQTNATVTRIVNAASAAGGAVDDWDVDVPAPAPGDPAGEKWAGRIGAYYREKVDRVSNGDGGVDVLVRRTVWVDTVDVPRELDTDDVVEVTGPGGPFAASAIAIARSELDGMGAVATTRIDLEPA